MTAARLNEFGSGVGSPEASETAAGVADARLCPPRERRSPPPVDAGFRYRNWEREGSIPSGGAILRGAIPGAAVFTGFPRFCKRPASAGRLLAAARTGSAAKRVEQRRAARTWPGGTRPPGSPGRSRCAAGTGCQGEQASADWGRSVEGPATPEAEAGASERDSRVPRLAGYALYGVTVKKVDGGQGAWEHPAACPKPPPPPRKTCWH